MDFELFNSVIPLEIKWMIYFIYEWNYIASLKKTLLYELKGTPQNRDKYLTHVQSWVLCKFHRYPAIIPTYYFIRGDLAFLICTKCGNSFSLTLNNDCGHLCSMSDEIMDKREDLYFAAKFAIFLSFLNDRRHKAITEKNNLSFGNE